MKLCCQKNLISPIKNCSWPSDGELSPREAGRVESHLAACWACRVRKQEIETAIGEFVRFQRQNFDLRIPPSDGPRALLKAQLAQPVEARARVLAAMASRSFVASGLGSSSCGRSGDDSHIASDVPRHPWR